MARSEARIFTRIWDPEDDFVHLDAGPQRMYMLLLSQPGLSLCGVIDFTPKRWAGLAANTTTRTVGRDLEALQSQHKIVVDRASEELWIRSYLKNDPGVFKSPNLVVGMASAYLAVASAAIRQGLAEQIVKGVAEGFPKGLPEGLSERLPEPFLKVLAEGYREPPNAGARARSPASAVASSPAAPSPPPTPTAGPASGALAGARRAVAGGKALPAGAGGEGEAWGAEGWTPSERVKAEALVDRVLTVVQPPKGRPSVREARSLVSWAAGHLDWGLVDEAIGYCGALSDTPRSVAYLGTTIRSWGAQRGVELPAFGNGRRS